VLVGYHFRYHPGLQQAARLLAEGAIGKPVSVHVHWGEYLPGWHPWEDFRDGYSARADLGGGVVLTLSHPLDYLRWLFGEVHSLWAFTAAQGGLRLDVEDVAEIGLRFENGMLGSVHLDYNQRPPAHRMEVVGTQGTLRWDNADGAALVYRASSDGAPPSEAAWQIFPAVVGRTFERNDLFLAEMRHFLDVAQHGAAPVCSLADGVQALRLALAALQSSQSGSLVRV
jgi:predicted dehydrogenase